MTCLCRGLARSLVTACSAALLATACLHGPKDARSLAPAGLQPGAADRFARTSLGRIAVRDAPDRPRLALVARSGDPSPAVAVAIWTGGDSTSATALAAIVQTRLESLGFEDVDAQVDRDGYRVRLLTPTPKRVREALNALKVVMLTPVVRGEPGLARAAKHLDALRRRPLDARELVSVASCTGELGLLPSSPRPALASAEGVAQLERWRSIAHGAARVAIAVVGPQSIGTAAQQLLDKQPAWPVGKAPDDPWPAQDTLHTYARAGAQARPRLAVALRIPSADVATSIAEQAVFDDSPLRMRLQSVTSWSVGRISATVRPRGACLALTLDRHPDAPQGNLAAEAAEVAALVIHELEAQVGEARSDETIAGRQVLRATDPRDAAGLAAWWSLGTRLKAGPDRLHVEFGVPTPTVAPNESDKAFDAALSESRRTFTHRLSLASQAWSRPVVEALTRVEAGQGELWVLVASPCGTGSETSGDAGITALAAVAAARARALDQVALEPWVTPDGVGILAHAAPSPGESAQGLAARVANAAARTLVRQHLPSQSVNAARSAILGLMDAPGSEQGDAVMVLAKQLAPTHPSLLAPFGLRQPVVEASARAASMRWAALAEGPVRVAVLANADEDQARAAVRATDRWMVHHAGQARACPVSPAPAPGHPSEPIDVTLRSSEAAPIAVLGLTVPKADARKGAMLALLAAALDGEDGWLRLAFASFETPVTARARLIGGASLSGLIIEVRCPDHVLDDAVRQARAVLERIAKGAATERDLKRATERLAKSTFSRQLNPRARIGLLWGRSPEHPPAVSLSAWKAFAASVLRDEAIGIVRVRPPAQEPESP